MSYFGGLLSPSLTKSIKYFSFLSFFSFFPRDQIYRVYLDNYRRKKKVKEKWALALALGDTLLLNILGVLVSCYFKVMSKYMQSKLYADGTLIMWKAYSIGMTFLIG